MLRYVHGSEDSLDLDVYYVFDVMPGKEECMRFCTEDKNENRNIIVINNGVVTDCFKGTNDENNNGIIDTYALHPQTSSLIITKRLERDKITKSVRAMRGILSLISRSQYRNLVKDALKNNWSSKIQALYKVDLTSIDYSNLHKNGSREDILKVIAFQLSQAIGLFEGIEIYTKSKAASTYPELQQFLYRQKDVNLNDLELYKKKLLDILSKIEVKEDREFTYFIEYKKYFNNKSESWAER